MNSIPEVCVYLVSLYPIHATGSLLLSVHNKTILL